MSRWSQYDEDSYRLPEGMERIGYDSDTGRYLFRSSGRSVWQGPQGAEYGEMTRVSDGGQDSEAAPSAFRADGYQRLPNIDNDQPMAHRTQVNSSDYRTLAPFFLLIGVVLLLVWKLVLAPGWTVPNHCPSPGTSAYLVEPGDNCWAIAATHNCSLQELTSVNNDVNCATLRPGMLMCVPEASPESSLSPSSSSLSTSL